MGTLAIPVVATIAGALVYAYAPGKAATLGIVTYGAGILVVLMNLAGHAIHF